MQNCVYWITGASSGIGEALTKDLNKQGHRIVISARREEELQRVQSECDFPEKISIVPLDLAEYSASTEWAEKALSCFGTIDTVIANGGVGQFGMVRDNQWSVEKQMVDVNLLGTMALVRSILPSLLKKKSGRIIGIASIAGKFGQRNLAAYSAAKAGVIIWLESLREEVYDSNITVQVVSPGFIQTQVMLNSIKPDGTPYNTQGKAQEKGMPLADFVKKFNKVIAGRKFHYYIGRRELLAVPAHALARTLFYKLLRRNYR